MYPKLIFYIRRVSVEETKERAIYNPMSREDYEIIQGYEPSKISGTYEEYLARSQIEYESIYPPNSEIGESFEVLKTHVGSPEDEIVVRNELKSRPDFDRFIG